MKIWFVFALVLVALVSHVQCQATSQPCTSSTKAVSTATSRTSDGRETTIGPTTTTATTSTSGNASTPSQILPRIANLLSSKLTVPSLEPTTFTTPSQENEVIRRMKAKPGVNSAIDAILVLVVIQTMLGLGCTMDLSLITEHLLQPQGIAIAAVCQFGVMPFVAFLMAKIFGLGKLAALAVLVTGTCPGGNLSNLLTYFLYGDMNLSILMSTISTLLALVFMPLCLFMYGSSWIEVSVIGQMIPFGGVVLSLIMTLIPVAIGIAIKSRYEKIANTILKISLFSVMVSFIALMTLSVILFGTSIFTAISGRTYLIAFIMPIIGYGSGYLLATGFRLPDASRRTVAIETGCQNSQLSSTILKMAFANEMGAYFLFPIYYALFQGLEGLGMVVAFRLYRRYYADDVMVPTSRVTYDKFDGEWGEGGEDMGRTGGGLYQHPSPSSSDDSMYGRLAIGEQDNRGERSQSVPNKLPLKHKFSPGELAKSTDGNHGDKSSLIPSDQRLTSGLVDYGGLN